MPFVGPLLEEGTCGILRAHRGSIPGVPLYHTRSKDRLPLAQCCRVTPPAMLGPSFPPPGPPVHTSPLSFPHLSFSCPWLLPFDVPFLFFQLFLLPLFSLPFSSPSFCFGGPVPCRPEPDPGSEGAHSCFGGHRWCVSLACSPGRRSTGWGVPQPSCAPAFRPQAGTSTLSHIFLFVPSFQGTMVGVKHGQCRPCDVSDRALEL